MSDALIVIDMLNTYDHDDGERCAANARDAVPAIRAAVAAARDRGDHVIYANDNYGLWSSDRAELIDFVLERVPDRDLVEPLMPADDDVLILKARHSIFYETSLAYLLTRREISRITLTGQVTEQCVLYSALDAHVRHFDVRVATDAVVAIDDELADAALRMMRRNMGAELLTVDELGGRR